LGQEAADGTFARGHGAIYGDSCWLGHQLLNYNLTLAGKANPESGAKGKSNTFLAFISLSF
jgi:hypothetical protein